MKTLHDHQGIEIRFTDERRAHVLAHPEMAQMEQQIEETLLEPERVIESMTDPLVHLYFAFIFKPSSGASSCAWS